MRLLLLAAMLLSAVAFPAVAAEPGTVQGTFQLRGKTVPVKYVYAQLRDNAEGLMDTPTQLRLLFTDREVPASALSGIVFLPVEDLAKEGRVEGLLVTLDPKHPETIHTTLLSRPAKEGSGLINGTQSGNVDKPFKSLNLTPDRVTGRLEYKDPGSDDPDFADVRPPIAYTLQFSAPVAKEQAVTADLKGKAALDSPQAHVLAAAAQAMISGDVVALRKLSTERANRQQDTALKLGGKAATAAMKQAGMASKAQLPKLQRLVVRGDSAIAIFPGKEWATLVREGGAWKIDF
jgi:hypothetical protein